MKKIIVVSILGLSLFGFLFLDRAFAQAAQCTDSDNSQVVNGVLRLGVDRLVRGKVRGRSRVTGRQDVAGDKCMPNGTLVEYFCANATDIGGSSVRCQQGEECVNGACMTQVVLNDCGTPAGGWKNATKYILNQDLVFHSGECFVIEEQHGNVILSDIVLDCQEHSIQIAHRGRDRVSTAIAVSHANNIAIQNCHIRGENRNDTGINIGGPVENIRIVNNEISDEGLGIGIAVTASGTYKDINISNNQVCNNFRAFACGEVRHTTH